MSKGGEGVGRCGDLTSVDVPADERRVCGAADDDEQGEPVQVRVRGAGGRSCGGVDPRLLPDLPLQQPARSHVGKWQQGCDVTD